jgi:hypothetical protein
MLGLATNWASFKHGWKIMHFFMKINNRGGTLLCRRFHKTELMNDEEDSYC